MFTQGETLPYAPIHLFNCVSCGTSFPNVLRRCHYLASPSPVSLHPIYAFMLCPDTIRACKCIDLLLVEILLHKYFTITETRPCSHRELTWLHARTEKPTIILHRCNILQTAQLEMDASPLQRFQNTLPYRCHIPTECHV